MTRPQAVEEEMKCAIGKDCGHPYHTFPMLANRVQVLAAEITRLEGENAALAKTIESYKHTVAGWRAHAALEVEAAALRKRVEELEGPCTCSNFKGRHVLTIACRLPASDDEEESDESFERRFFREPAAPREERLTEEERKVLAFVDGYRDDEVFNYSGKWAARILAAAVVRLLAESEGRKKP